MFTRALGEIIALGAVAGWTVSALAFETAAKRIGSVPVNTIRMVKAAVSDNGKITVPKECA